VRSAVENSSYVRAATGEVVASQRFQTDTVKVEVLRRHCSGPQGWQFCQPDTSLFWFRQGFNCFHGRVNGGLVERRFVGHSRLSIIPDGTEIDARIDLDEFSDLVAVFFDTERIQERLGTRISEFRLAFEHQGIMAGLDEIASGMDAPDAAFGLQVEGWALQAVAHMYRASQRHSAVQEFRGGMSTGKLRQVEEFVLAKLAEEVQLDDLAKLVGLSARHFVRAFRESVQTTPYQYVLTLKMQRAKQLLAETNEPVIAIGAQCGFQNPQHFATTFRRIVGASPTQFRRNVVSGRDAMLA